MSSPSQSFLAVWDHIRAVDTGIECRLQLPITGIHDIHELRSVVREGKRRGLFCDDEEVLAGVILVNLTEEGRRIL